MAIMAATMAQVGMLLFSIECTAALPLSRADSTRHTGRHGDG